MILGTRETM